MNNHGAFVHLLQVNAYYILFLPPCVFRRLVALFCLVKPKSAIMSEGKSAQRNAERRKQ